MNIKNIAFYKFFKPNFDLAATRDILRGQMCQLGIKGTILLGPEGINASLSGIEPAMDNFLDFLLKSTGILNPAIKISYSPTIPFKRSMVKIKPYIVHDPGPTAIDPLNDTAPYISPEEFHQWMTENKKMVVLDTRNDYEYQAGRFRGSLHLGTRHFADFEGNLQSAPAQWQQMPVVTFCTGGIRCEKAAPLLCKKGFPEVYQLDGGILNYFKKIGQGFFEGECFVFDERNALGPGAHSNV